MRACAIAGGKYAPLRSAFAIPNGGARSEITGAILRREGVRAGTPDVFIPVPVVRPDGTVSGGLFLELKRPGAAVRASAVQRRRHLELADAGYTVVIARGALEAWALATAYIDSAQYVLTPATRVHVVGEGDA